MDRRGATIAGTADDCSSLLGIGGSIGVFIFVCVLVAVVMVGSVTVCIGEFVSDC